MHLLVNNTASFVSTGSRPHKAGQPFLIFLHGSGQSHLSFAQQSRSFAYDGYNVVTPDFPGHGHSKGEALSTIEAMADWVIALMDALHADDAILVGHSQGCLIVLELAARFPARVKAAAFIAGSAAIPVNEHLVAMAEKVEPKAIAAMMSWGSGLRGHKHDNTVPGASHIGAGIHLMSMNASGALAADLKSCNAYQAGADQAKKITCPTLCILAERDRMTPMKAGRALADALPNNRVSVVAGAGHMLTVENPREVNTALREFLSAH